MHESPHQLRVRPVTLAGALMLSCVALGTAQPAGQPGTPSLRRVDPGIGDVGPLGMSARDLGVDLRVPTGFRDVYRIGDPRNLRSDSGLFTRVDGATYAVFPRSVYRETKDGVIPEVPPGTVFYIGGLPASLTGAPAEAVPSSPYYADTQAATRVLDGGLAAPTKGAPYSATPSAFGAVSAGIFAGEPVRVRVVHELLAQAATAAKRPRLAIPK